MATPAKPAKAKTTKPTKASQERRLDEERAKGLGLERVTPGPSCLELELVEDRLRLGVARLGFPLRAKPGIELAAIEERLRVVVERDGVVAAVVLREQVDGVARGCETEQCAEHGDAYARLVGLNLLQGFRAAVKERLVTGVQRDGSAVIGVRMMSHSSKNAPKSGLVAGPRMLIVTSSGGSAIIATDVAADNGFRISPLPDAVASGVEPLIILGAIAGG